MGFARSFRRPVTRFPIAILSFDRPDYLQRVLLSLRPQVSQADRIVLFQDGARNPYSKQQKADPGMIDACIQIFRSSIPWGIVAASEHNLGIADNYERAEREIFKELDAPAGLFLEDDLVLSPNYLAVTEMLLDLAQRDRRISYVSAYGHFWADPADQMARRRDLIHMHENWGFAMTQEAWRAERPFRRQYLKLVQGRDYTQRDHDAIVRFYRNRGWNLKPTSQDAARWIASIELGRVRLTTFPCHARYIGRHGVHFTEEAYERAGFASSQLFGGTPIVPNPPTDRQFAQWLAEERGRFKDEPKAFYPGHVTGVWP
jgi:hypothetical protein